MNEVMVIELIKYKEVAKIQNCRKKCLNDLDNHDGVITHLEPDILECEDNTNKASGGDGIPVELFKILKDDAVKVLHSICQVQYKLP